MSDGAGITLIVLFVVLVILLTIYYHLVSLGLTAATAVFVMIAIFVAIISAILYINNEIALRSAKIEADKRKKEALDKLKQRLRNLLNDTIPAEIKNLLSNISDDTSELGNNLNAATSHALEAGKFYDKKMPVPFWESMEAALDHIRQVQEAICSLERHAQKPPLENIFNDCEFIKTFKMVITSSGCEEVVEKSRQAVMPTLNSAIETIPDTSKSLAELINLVSVLKFSAFKSHEFSVIYEQRRTTSAIQDGFASLNARLFSMESRIVSSIESLHTTLSAMHHDMRAGFSELSAQISDGFSAVSERLDNVGDSMSEINGLISSETQVVKGIRNDLGQQQSQFESNRRRQFDIALQQADDIKLIAQRVG